MGDGEVEGEEGGGDGVAGSEETDVRDLRMGSH